jgi:mono/diheme cytochrome c family protein
MHATMRAAVVALILVPSMYAVSRGAQTKTKVDAQKEEIARGRYLVEHVAECGDCHTPRNARGELERDEWLQGAPIWIVPVKPIANWAPRAPALAGLPSFTNAQAERVLENGTGPEGEKLRPPMHTYHMTSEDAKAIVAYLRSLPRSIR